MPNGETVSYCPNKAVTKPIYFDGMGRGRKNQNMANI